MKTRIEIYHSLSSQDEDKLINIIQDIIKYSNATNLQIYYEKHNMMKNMFKPKENIKNISVSFNNKISAEKFLEKFIDLSVKSGITYGYHELILSGCFMIFLVTNIISEYLQLGGTWNIVTGIRKNNTNI